MSTKRNARSRPTKRLRVIHVIHNLAPGGAEALLYRLATRSSEFDHEVVSLLAPDWYSKPLKEAGIPVHHLGIGSVTSAVAAVPRLRRLLTLGDVVQTWMYRSNVYAGLVARSAGVPVVWGVHAGSFGPLGLSPRLWALAGGITAAFVPSYVINCSNRSAELHRKLGYGSSRGSVIPNGYDPDRFSPDEESRRRVRAALACRADDFVIGAIARWHKQKDIPNLLRGIRLAADAGVPVRCILIGNGLDDVNPQLAALLAQTNTADLTRPLGRRSDVHELARAMDVHLLASSGGEAFPNAIGETMLSSVPNVVTDVGDAGLIVSETGWVVPPAQPAALAAALEEAWGECNKKPRSWEDRRQAARQRIVDNFTFERMAKAYERVWLEAAGRSAP